MKYYQKSEKHTHIYIHYTVSLQWLAKYVERGITAQNTTEQQESDSKC